MNSIKCHKCNLVNFADATVCKRCKTDITIAPSDISNQENFVISQSKSSIRSTTQPTSVKPSFVRIVKNDYGALLGLMLPLVLWGVFIATNVFGFSVSRKGREMSADSNDSTFLYIAIIGTIVGIALLAWRIYSFQQVFANGEETVGRISSISFFKDRGRIEYSYSVNGQIYQAGNAIMKNKVTQSFQDGDEIELIVDLSNPSRAFIKALYS